MTEDPEVKKGKVKLLNIHEPVDKLFILMDEAKLLSDMVPKFSCFNAVTKDKGDVCSLQTVLDEIVQAQQGKTSMKNFMRGIMGSPISP